MREQPAEDTQADVGAEGHSVNEASNYQALGLGAWKQLQPNIIQQSGSTGAST